MKKRSHQSHMRCGLLYLDSLYQATSVRMDMKSMSQLYSTIHSWIWLEKMRMWPPEPAPLLPQPPPLPEPAAVLDPPAPEPSSPVAVRQEIGTASMLPLMS